MSSSRTLALCVLCGLVGASAQAQWTVVNLHPAGADSSRAYDASGLQQIGTAMFAGIPKSSLWTGSAASWVDLTPPGGVYSQGRGIAGGTQAGYAGVGSFWHASIWSGTAASWVDLHPAGQSRSFVSGIGGGQQAGYSSIDGFPTHAAVWSGTAASWVDLHPAWALDSIAHGAGGGQQVGRVFFDGYDRPGLWTGTAASWVSLLPAGAVSGEAFDTDGFQQVGYAVASGQRLASVWLGTAASWVNLHPSGHLDSFAYGVHSGMQVGETIDASYLTHASLWIGSSASWVDLHALCPASFNLSRATGIWMDGSTIRISGYGFNTLTNREEALLWVFNGAVLPAQYTLVFGSLVGGNLQSLHFSDNDRLVATVDTASEALNPVWIETRGTCPITNPSSVQLVVEALADLDGRWTYLRMFDYVANQWVDVHGGTVNTLEATITVTVSGNASRFVHPTTREMRAAMLFQDGTAETLQPVTISIDRAMWIVRP